MQFTILNSITEVVEIEEDVDEPAPPTAAAVKEEAEVPKENGICRERKLVDKVFKDEKGFIGKNY
jgi:hypothetical protein